MVMTDHACFKGSFNTSGATFAATITNEKSMEEVEFGRIYTTNPNPAKYTCEQMPVNGGSFQEYYDGALQYRVPTHTHTHPTPPDSDAHIPFMLPCTTSRAGGRACVCMWGW